MPLRHGPDDLAKRHQPLTLLWSLGRARRGEQRLVAWPIARDQIGRLIRDSGRPADRPNSELPFLALASSGLWDLTAVPPKGLTGTARRRWLNNASPVVRAGLTEPVYRLFAAQRKPRRERRACSWRSISTPASASQHCRQPGSMIWPDRCPCHCAPRPTPIARAGSGQSTSSAGSHDDSGPGSCRPGGFLSPFKPRADADYLTNVAGGPFRRSRAHETLVNDFARWLSDRGLNAASNAAIDLGVIQPPVIIEAKIVRSGRWATAIREAVGQLYEYRYFQVVSPESALIFLASAEIPGTWLSYLHHDRQIGAAWPTAFGFQLTAQPQPHSASNHKAPSNGKSLLDQKLTCTDHRTGMPSRSVGVGCLDVQNDRSALVHR